MTRFEGDQQARVDQSAAVPRRESLARRRDAAEMPHAGESRVQQVARGVYRRQPSRDQVEPRLSGVADRDRQAGRREPSGPPDY